MSETSNNSHVWLRRVVRHALVTLISIHLLQLPASAAGSDAAEAEIRRALANWTESFNARRTSEICELFDPGLRYDYRGFPERDYQAICSNLQRSLSDPTKQYLYAAEIKEVLIFGDVAVVRLVWTLKTALKGAPGESVSREPGVDIFKRQPDGSWRIIRYMAYEEVP